MTARRPMKLLGPIALFSVLLTAPAAAEDMRSAGASGADGMIATEIERQFDHDPNVNASAVKIEVRNGIVTLNGRVVDDDAKTRAAHVAAKVDGVTDVRNEITVGSGSGLGRDGGPGPIPDEMPGSK